MVLMPAERWTSVAKLLVASPLIWMQDQCTPPSSGGWPDPRHPVSPRLSGPGRRGSWGWPMRSQPNSVLGPDDMAMLERVLQKLLPESADTAEREWLGSLLIAAFQNGTTDEAALVATMDRKAKP